MILTGNRNKIRATIFIKFLLLTGLVIIFFTPLVSMFITSIKTRGELYAYPPVVFPDAAQWENYVSAWTMINYPKFLWNSIILAFFYTVPCIMGSALAGYGFARFNTKANKLLFPLMLSTMMIPYMVTIIPLYLILMKTGMVNKMSFWILWGVQGTPFLIFLFKQYFSTIPLSFEESARLDGAGRFQIFFQIMFPLVQTAVVIAAIFSFQWVWSNFLLPNLLLSGDKVNLAVKLAKGYSDVKDNVLYNIGMAGIVYYTLPIAILFFTLQKKFIAGLTAGGLKG